MVVWGVEGMSEPQILHSHVGRELSRGYMPNVSNS